MSLLGGEPRQRIGQRKGVPPEIRTATRSTRFKRRVRPSHWHWHFTAGRGGHLVTLLPYVAP